MCYEYSTMSSTLMTQQYIFKMSLNRNTHKTILICICQLRKMWCPEACGNLTLCFNIRAVLANSVSMVAIIQCPQQL